MGSVYDSDEWAGFVRGIRAEPEEDTPRLVAADWLDDHGEHERAELIRLQCQIDPQLFPLADLANKEWAIFESHAPFWFSWRNVATQAYPDSALALHRVNEVGGSQYDIERGFVSAVTATDAW